MQKVARFEKVSFEQFLADWNDTFQDKDKYPQFNEEVIKAIYDEIKLPKRATTGSMGYDFFMPYGLDFFPGTTHKIPTGIRVLIDEGWGLKCYPRSGLGFKYRLQLDNTVGIIDSDYSGSKNEGHIMLKMTCNSNKAVLIKAGEGFAQGIFLPFGITYDDESNEVRDGGFGSTTK
jgi:dUTP pyrophosphatase